MKKILMISYYYPPLADVGSLRALAFSKYLPEIGCTPYVISVKNPDKCWCIMGNGRPPADVETHYTRSLMNLTLITGKLNGLLARIAGLFGITLRKNIVRDIFCIPDQFVGWIPLTFLKGMQLIKKHDIDIIYVSCKPFSSTITGALLKWATGKPLVLDFRDPVSPLFFTSQDTYYRHFPAFLLTRKIEELVLRYADKFIVVTEETKELYLSFFPFLRNKVQVIYNGFMEEYFPETNGAFEKFTIVYSGNFYPESIPPDPFFRALQNVVTKERGLRGRLQFLYVGGHSDWIREMAEKYDLGDIIRVTGYVSRRESIEYICKASILLLRIVPGMISTKLFEGLAAGVPILAPINEGEVAGIIRNYSNCPYYIVQPDDVAGIERAITDAYAKWRNGKLIKRRNPAFYEDFNKKSLTAKFLDTLERIS